MKRKKKFKDWDNFNKKHLIDNLNSMLSEPSELWRPTRDRLVRKKDNKLRSEPKELNNSWMPDLSNNKRNKECLRSRQEPRKQSLKLLFANRSKSEKLNKNSKKKESNFWKNTQKIWKSRLSKNKRLASSKKSWKKSKTKNSKRLMRHKSIW